MNSVLKTQIDYVYNSKEEIKNLFDGDDLYYLIIELKKPNSNIGLFKKLASKSANIFEKFIIKSNENEIAELLSKNSSEINENNNNIFSFDNSYRNIPVNKFYFTNFFRFPI